ncbi:MAG: crossover junction endodeoxyribonuclease RuvC [Ilumatobacteraceae bacterium]
MTGYSRTRFAPSRPSSTAPVDGALVENAPSTAPRRHRCRPRPATPRFVEAVVVDTVVGIDPYLTRCGYAVLRAAGSVDGELISMGVIKTPPTDPLPNRLAELRGELASLMDEFRPDAVSVEHVFFQVNVRTAMSVGQASGLALAEAAARGCEVAQYTPNQVKQTIWWWGCR